MKDADALDDVTLNAMIDAVAQERHARRTLPVGFDRSDMVELARTVENQLVAQMDPVVPVEGWELQSIIPKPGTDQYICMIHTMYTMPVAGRVRMKVGYGKSPNDALADANRQAMEEPTDD